jgi:hypothetical protein
MIPSLSTVLFYMLSVPLFVLYPVIDKTHVLAEYWHPRHQDSVINEVEGGGGGGISMFSF